MSSPRSDTPAERIRSATAPGSRAPGSGEARPVGNSPPAPQTPPWKPILVALLATHLCQPLTWADPRIPLWSPNAGLALVLVAWFGWRLGAGILIVSGLLVLGQQVIRWAWVGGLELHDLNWILIETTLLPLEAVSAWWVYHGLSRGSRRLIDPRSAMQFVLLVPGLCAGVSALVHLGFAWLIEVPELGPGGFVLHLARFWLARALGMLIVAPPLLILATPWLHRRGWLRPVASAARPSLEISDGLLIPSPDASSGEEEVGSGSQLGDWLEIIGLALAAGILCLLLSRLHGRGELLGWQLWGGQMLLIVWAGMRQGLRGGTVVASVAACLPLIDRSVRPFSSAEPLFEPLLQGHLAAQCSAALLVAAGSSWVRRREAGYRQVVSLVPVVIYSAKLLKMPRGGVGVGVAEVTLVSAASNKLLGCPAAQLLGDYSRWLACVYAEDREVVLAAVEQLARQNEPVTCEYRLAPPLEGGSVRRSAEVKSTSLSGEIVVNRAAARWLRDTLAPRRDGEGRLLGWEGVVIEITEQRALADDLRRTTSMFHALVGNLPAGVFFVQGPHGQPILVNARARQLLGQREDASAGLEYLPQVYRLFRADGTLYPAAELPVYLALRQGLTTMRDDIIVHRPDGRRVPLVTWAAPVDLGGRGSPGAAVWVFEDLTALRQAEAARKDTEGRLRALIETMAEGLLVYDDRGRIVNCNPAACAFFGMPAEKVRGRTAGELPWVFFHERGGKIAPEEYPSQIVLRTGRPVRHVVLGVQSPGMSDSGAGSCHLSRWILVNAVPLGGSVENPEPPGAPRRAQAAGVVTTFADISAYVHARETIRVSEERYRGLVESLPLMLLQSDRDMRITYVNPATTAITGYGLEEIANPGLWAGLVHAEDLPVAYRMSRTALSGQTDQGEIRYRARDGTEKVAYCISQPRQQDGVVVGTTALLVDLTRERRLENELQRAQRLELIGRLSSGVAHDFNNLLGVVLNLTDIARGHLPAEHPVHADLRRISSASEAAAGLASQMLALSKQRPAPARRVDLNQVARRTLELVQATLPSGVSLDANLAQGEMAIHADETQIQQVLMNLCLNARDAMPAGGVLHVTTTCEDSQVRLLVSDTGQGMSEAVRSRIFEPFFSTKEGGTGLGLAVVQQVVESQGGTVAVSSEPNRGSRFDVRWPATT